MKDQKEHSSKMMELGMLIKNWRKSEGLTRDELHLISGVHPNSIRRAESGKNITIQNLLSIADGLGIDVGGLFFVD